MRKMEGNTDVTEKHWLAAFCTHPNWGPHLQCRHVPWPRNGLATFHFEGQYSAKWATPAGQEITYLRGCIRNTEKWLNVITF